MSIVSLIHRSAWPGFHHFSVSKGNTQTLNGLVSNEGTIPLTVVIDFTVVKPDHTAVGLLTSPIQIAPGQNMVVTLNYVPDLFGGYIVSAIAGIVTPTGFSAMGESKRFTFEVVD